MIPFSSSSAVCLTHIGKRPNHEDNFLFNGIYLPSGTQQQMADRRFFFITGVPASRIHLFAISDGMGGHNAGETASLICVKSLAELEKAIQNCSSIRDAVSYAQSNIAMINTIICELSRRHKKLKGMGATLVLFIVCGSDYAVLNIGDSRAYYFDGNTLVQITKDNTEGQRMLDLGLLTQKELTGFPARKNLSRYVGYGQDDFTLHADEYYPVLKDGIMLLCSDGISDFLSDSQILSILRSECNLEIAGRQLIEAAADAVNADNSTAILIPLRR